MSETKQSSDFALPEGAESLPAMTRHEQYRYRFPNGYAASVVRSEFTYGGPEGFFEVAVQMPEGGLVYDTPVTDDVLGWQSTDDVSKVLAEIAALPTAPGASHE